MSAATMSAGSLSQWNAQVKGCSPLPAAGAGGGGPPPPPPARAGGGGGRILPAQSRPGGRRERGRVENLRARQVAAAQHPRPGGGLGSRPARHDRVDRAEAERGDAVEDLMLTLQDDREATAHRLPAA